LCAPLTQILLLSRRNDLNCQVNLGWAGAIVVADRAPDVGLRVEKRLWGGVARRMAGAPPKAEMTADRLAGNWPLAVDLTGCCAPAEKWRDDGNLKVQEGFTASGLGRERWWGFAG
jgi:hypothetical protein